MSDDQLAPANRVAGSVIQVTGVSHSGWSADGRQITLTFKLLSDGLATFTMPTSVGENVIRAAQHGLTGASRLRPQTRTAGETPYDAESISILMSDDGKHVILVFEGVGGPSRHIRLQAKGLPRLRRHLKDLEGKLRYRRSSPNDRQ